MTKVIVDTGPLVAFLAESDAAHRWAGPVFAEFEPPLLTCDVVIAEAFHLLTQTRSGADGLMNLLETKTIRLFSLADLDASAVRKLLLRYKNVPMDLADACVVRLSEMNPKARVVTLDTDFRIYRRNRREAIPLIMPSHK